MARLRSGGTAWVLAAASTLAAQQTITVRAGGPVATIDGALRLAGTATASSSPPATGCSRSPGRGTPGRHLRRGHAGASGGGNHELLRVTADGVRMRGLVFRNVRTSFIDDLAAVRFVEVEGCAVEDSRFEATFFGRLFAEGQGLPDHREPFHGRREERDRLGERHSPVELEPHADRGQRDQPAPRRHLPRVRAPRGRHRQRERGKLPLRPALHVLRQLQLSRQHLPTERRRHRRHVLEAGGA